ncbi:MAG: dockerin type I repeat-containing protein [Clostridia bacterium]|nr:dockerin type I repeat-containing protein [Clostridia bacterium]
MTKFKRIMAVLMSVVMICGTVSVAATAAYSPYLGDAIIDQYNSIDKVDLSIEQKASIILDDLDVMLEKEDIFLDIPVIGTIDLTSIDGALNSIYNLTGNWLFGTLTVGDLAVLEDYRGDIASERRSSADNTDMDVIRSLVTYLSNCAPTLLGMFGDDFNWGIVHGFLPPEFRMIIDDFNRWLDDLIWDLLHPVNDEAMPLNPTLDYFVQFLCDNQLAGKRPEIMGFDGVMPGFEVNVETDKAYKVIEQGIYEALNAFIVPVLNSDLKTVIREAVESNQAEGGELYLLIDTNYVVGKYEFDHELGFAEQVNDMLKSVVDTMLLPDNFNWKSTAEGVEEGMSNTQNLRANLVGLLKTIIEAGGETEDVSTYSLKQLGDYIARVAVEEFVKHLDFEKGDTMEKIAYEGLRELVVRFAPEVTYPDMPAGTTSEQYREKLYEMGADIACYYLNASIGLECSFDTTADEFISAFIAWCMPYIDGLFDVTEFNQAENGWEKIDAILWQFIPKDWFNVAGMFGGATEEALTFKSLLDYIIDIVFNMDIEKLFAFFDNVENSALNRPVRNVILEFVANILNTAFYVEENGVKKDIVDLTKITSFDSIVNPISNAADIICGLLKSLAQRPALQNTVLNLVTMLMGLGDPQSLGEVGIDLDSRINCTSGSIPSDTKMRITNYSDGVNSGWLPENSTVIDQDKMYEIELVSLTNNAGLTASVAAGTKIAANAYYDVAVSGAVSETKEARFDLEYYILDEDGVRLNDGTPLVKSVFTHLYTENSEYYDENSAESSANNVTFEGFSTYYYTTDVYSVSLFSILATNETGLVTNAVDVTRAIITGTLPAGIAAHAPEDGVIVHIDDSSITSASYGTVNPYVSVITDPNAEQPYGIYDDITIQFEVRGKNWLGQTTTATTAARDHKIVIYNDFGLPGVLDEVMGANRQRVDFINDAQTEWDAYLAAVADGYALLNGNPDHGKMFNDVVADLEGVQNEYYLKVEAINAAVEALDAKAKATDAEKLAVLNAEIAEYEDVDSDNYVLFTYDRFEDAYDRAASLANSQVAEEGDEDFVAPSIPVFDLVYAAQQLDLWGSRLIKRATVKTQFENVLGPVENWTEDDVALEWWDSFDAARDAAVAVKNDPDALQTEVNDARIELMKAMKGIKPRYLNAAEDTETVIDSVNMLIYGIEPEIEEITDFINPVLDYTVECNMYIEDGYYIGTGSTVNVSDTTGIIATYTVILYGDINGDGEIDSNDAAVIYAYLNGGSTLIEEGNVFFEAADVNFDGIIDATDRNIINAGTVVQIPTN